jgi:hypothetical protein
MIRKWLLAAKSSPAAGAGSAAAIAINADLVDDDVRNAAHAVNHGDS